MEQRSYRGVFKEGGLKATPTVELPRVFQCRPFLKVHFVGADFKSDGQNVRNDKPLI